MNRLQTFEFTKGSRLIAISDIHGRYDLLDSLLKKVGYKKNVDNLILMGDYSQKGPYPLKTLRYIMELSKNDHVYCLLGNCDHGNYKIFYPKYVDNEFISLLNIKTSLLYDMKNEYFSKYPEKINLTYKELQKEMELEFEKELSFLKGLPLMLETKDFLFVHAGVDKIRNYHNSWYRSIFMKRYFYYQGHLLDKIVVCGHMPVTIYRDEFDDNILFDFKRKIISIDGGMVVKAGGDLNALIIENMNNRYIYKYSRCNGLNKRKLLNDSYGIKRGKGACWPNFKLKVIEEGKYFSKILLEDINEITYIKNEYINHEKNSALDDCPASILDIKKDEYVGIVDDTCKGYTLVKYKGKQGWIKRDLLGGVNEEDS